MNAIEYLLEEHRRHRESLDLIETDESAFPEFRREFIHHVNVEEAILYPNLLKIPELESVVRLAWEEHSLCMQLIQEMDSTDVGSAAWKTKFTILKKLVLDHLEEEEDELFPKIRELASPEFLNEVREQMMFQKELTDTEEIIYPDEPGSHKLHP